MSATSSSGGSSAGAEIQNVAPRGARGAVQPEEQGDGGSTARMGEVRLPRTYSKSFVKEHVEVVSRGGRDWKGDFFQGYVSVLIQKRCIVYWSDGYMSIGRLSDISIYFPNSVVSHYRLNLHMICHAPIAHKTT